MASNEQQPHASAHTSSAQPEIHTAARAMRTRGAWGGGHGGEGASAGARTIDKAEIKLRPFGAGPRGAGEGAGAAGEKPLARPHLAIEG